MPRIDKRAVYWLLAGGLFLFAVLSYQMGRSTGTTSRSSSVAAWRQDNMRVMAGLVDAFNEIAKAGHAEDPAAMVSGCRYLHSAISDARDAPPIPDAEAQGHWSAALSNYDRSAEHCIRGATTMDLGELRSDLRDMDKANKELDRVLAQF